MRIPRIFTEQDLQTGAELKLDEGPARHLTRVLRLRGGDALILFNGMGGEFPSTISRLERDAVWVTPGQRVTRDVESPLHIGLAQGISRGERMDYTLQKAVELGVRFIQPLVTERSVVRLEGERAEKRVAHWQSIVHAACEQSGRNFVPRVHAPQALSAWLRGLPPDLQRLTLAPAATTALRDVEMDVQRPVVLLIGPEGGLSAAEIAGAQQAGFVEVRLGPRVLRTETAGVTALAVMQSRWGDL